MTHASEDAMHRTHNVSVTFTACVKRLAAMSSVFRHICAR